MEWFEILHIAVSVAILVFVVEVWMMEAKRKYFPKDEDKNKYNNHLGCKKCGQSITFSTQEKVEYCPFCGEEYARSSSDE